MKRPQHGQGAVEFLVVFVLLLTMLGGLFELTRVIRTKLLLRSATFEATRIGAMHHARRAPMQAELANGMSALFTFGDRSPQGLIRAQLRARALASAPGVGIAILHPTQQHHAALARQQWLHLHGTDGYQWQTVIPNDNLRWRPRTTDGDSGITVQDANLLNTHSVWCHRLVVPALDRLIHSIAANPLWASPSQGACSALGNTTASSANITAGRYIAVTGGAILRMQSAVVNDDLPGV